MSDNFKNLLLFILLIALCGMIKCKIDSDNKITGSKVSSKPKIAQKEILAKKASDSDIATDNAKAKEQEKEEKTTPESEDPQVKQIVKQKKVTKPAKKITKARKKAIRKMPKPAPKLEFEEMMWDFGEITEGDIVSKKFKFTNTGNANLEIFSATATCGCTRPTFPFIDIAPGESNTISITYNSVNKNGPQTPKITIESNSKPKIVILKLKGVVNPKEKAKKEKNSTTIDSLANKG